MASASKDETVILWNLERIKQNLNKMVDHQDFIMTVIDEHEHVIDCIRFAPEAACHVIMKADYNKYGGNSNVSGELIDETLGVDTTRGADDSEMMEEHKKMEGGDISRINESMRLTTKEKVQKLKEDLKKRKAMLRGEIEQTDDADPSLNQTDISLQIDTKAQEQRLVEEGELKEFIATGSRDKKIRIFEVRSGRCVVTLSGHDNWITDLMFHPNGKYLISTADDKSIRVWDLKMGMCYRKIYNAHEHFITCFDMKGKLAATGSVDTSVKLWGCR